MAAQPPGPGLPIQAPSVMSRTFFKGMWSLWDGYGDDARKNNRTGMTFMTSAQSWGLGAKERIHAVEDFPGFAGMVDLRPQPGAIADAVREISGELLHLANSIALFALD